MKTITFRSNNEDKIDLLIKVAAEMGIESYDNYSVLEDEMGLPGPKISDEQLSTWLENDKEEATYTSEEVLDYVRKELEKKRTK